MPSWNAFGASVNATKAQQVVTGWLRTDKAPLQTKLGSAIGRVEVHKDAKQIPLYYAVELDPGGFVIVAADDLIEPIVAFSSDGTYDSSAESPLTAMITADLPNRLAEAKKLQLKGNLGLGVFRSAQDKWDLLSASATDDAPRGMVIAASVLSSSISDLRVAPLVQTQWDQGNVGSSACYNYYTPSYATPGNPNNYISGCVATAMAQLMRYWQFPTAGIGSASYTVQNANQTYTQANWTPIYGNYRGGNGSGGPYDWANMVLAPSETSTVQQFQAIGALCADAGGSVGMVYNRPDGSGANAIDYAVPALKTVFGYSNGISGYNSNNTIPFSALLTMVNPNLDAGAPVLFALTASTGGHEIVCDGYGYDATQTLYHHLNMGWSGSGNVWYTLPSVGSYNVVQGCQYNIWPTGTGEIISGRIVDGRGAGIGGLTVTATRTGGGTALRNDTAPTYKGITLGFRAAYIPAD